jgi:hypothetical protein
MQGILVALALARSLATAPVHWHAADWKRFAEGTAVVATVYVADDRAHFPSDVVAGALIGRAVAKGIVFRNAKGKRAWSIEPGIVNRRPVLLIALH